MTSVYIFDIPNAWESKMLQVLVKIENKQEYRHVEKPGWKLSWHWVNKTVIWDMRGAETTEQGNCSAFASSETLPHCCLRRPTIVDLLPGAPFNMQVSNCCRGGVLTSMSQDRINYVSAFHMTIGSFPGDPGEFIMPYDFDIGVPGYTCGNATSVDPTKYSTDKGRRKTQALGKEIHLLAEPFLLFSMDLTRDVKMGLTLTNITNLV